MGNYEGLEIAHEEVLESAPEEVLEIAHAEELETARSIVSALKLKMDEPEARAKEATEQERAANERERAANERERAANERERAANERERAANERAEACMRQKEEELRRQDELISLLDAKKRRKEKSRCDATESLPTSSDASTPDHTRVSQDTAEIFPPTPAQLDPSRHMSQSDGDLVNNTRTGEADGAMAPPSGNLETLDSRVNSEVAQSLDGCCLCGRPLLSQEVVTESSPLPVVIELNRSAVPALIVAPSRIACEAQTRNEETRRDETEQLKARDQPVHERRCNGESATERKRLIKKHEEVEEDEEPVLPALTSMQDSPNEEPVIRLPWLPDPPKTPEVYLSADESRPNSGRKRGRRKMAKNMFHHPRVNIRETLRRPLKRPRRNESVESPPRGAIKQARFRGSRRRSQHSPMPTSTRSSDSSESKEEIIDLTGSDTESYTVVRRRRGTFVDYIDVTGSDTESCTVVRRRRGTFAATQTQQSQRRERPKSRRQAPPIGRRRGSFAANQTQQSQRRERPKSRRQAPPEKALNLLMSSPEDDEEEDDDDDEMKDFIEDKSTSPDTGESDDDETSPDENESSSDMGDSDDEVDSGNIINEKRVRRRRPQIWEFQGDMLTAIENDDDIALQAICALYRQQTEDERVKKRSLHTNGRGFTQRNAYWGSIYAEWLVDGDEANELKKSPQAFERHFPGKMRKLKAIAKHHSKQLYEIYTSKEDPYWR